MKAILSLLVAASMALSAPVPKEAAKKPEEVVHGTWRLEWNNSPYTATLSGNGEFSEFLGNGPQWLGMWTWDSGTRILTVRESTNGEFFIEWSAVLDKEMRGTTENGTKIRLLPFRPPVKMQEGK